LRYDLVSGRFDARVEVRSAAAKPIKGHTRIRLYLGTAEVLGKIIWLDRRPRVAPRESAYGQLVLRDGIHTVRGDRFILRDETAQRTIGGGVVVHPFARRHRANEPQMSARLDRLRLAVEPASIVRALLDLECDLATELSWLAQAGELSVDEVRAAVIADPSLRPLPGAAAATACMTTDHWQQLQESLVSALRVHHEAEPLVAGVEMESLRGKVAHGLSQRIFRAFVDAIVSQGIVVREESLLRLPAHRVALKKDEADIAARAEALIAAGGVTPVGLKEVEKSLNVPRAKLQAVLKQLVREGRVVQVDSDLCFASAAVEQARSLLRAHAEAHGGIDAATFRDLLGASRKYSIALLDYFDRTGFTLRVGDVRKLRRD
jgi:selenocysteine-specific elongation factor